MVIVSSALEGSGTSAPKRRCIKVGKGSFIELLAVTPCHEDLVYYFSS